MLLRAGTYEDIPQIVNVHVACWREVYGWMPDAVLKNRDADYRERQWKKWFSNPDGILYVAQENNNLIGFCHAGDCVDSDLQADGEMRAGYILPSYRGGTLGLLMMREMAEWMTGRGMVRGGIWAFQSNRYRYWYSHLGWEARVRRNRNIAGHAIPEVGYLWPDLRTLPARINALLENTIDRAAS